MAAAIRLFPEESFCGSPLEVKTLNPPYKKTIKEMPPAIEEKIPTTAWVKPPGVVGRQPITVQLTPSFNLPVAS